MRRAYSLASVAATADFTLYFAWDMEKYAGRHGYLDLRRAIAANAVRLRASLGRRRSADLDAGAVMPRCRASQNIVDRARGG